MKNNRTHHNIRLLLTCLFGVLLLSVAVSCGPKAPTADQAATSLAEAVRMQVTQFAIQSATAFKSPTATVEPAATLPPTVPAPVGTSTSTPAPPPSYDFNNADVYYAYYSGESDQVTLTVPNGIKGDFYATVGSDTFECFTYISKGLPRLICIGPAQKRGTAQMFKVFIKATGVQIYDRIVSVP